MENNSLHENEFYDAREECSIATRDENSDATTSQRGEDRAVTLPSVTAAEPWVDDDDDDDAIHLEDPHIPTIRLSSLGTALEKDFATVQNELGNSISTDGFSGEGFSDELTTDHMDVEKGNYMLRKNNSLATKVKEMSDSNPVTPSASEEEEVVLVEDHQTPLQPQRQRLVSGDGVIAEFDINPHASHSNDSDADDVVAEAIEIDASDRDASLRSMDDLELGDEEPLPYPGRRSASSRASGRPSSDMYNGNSATLFGSAVGVYGRAELLSATVIKNSPTEQVGINLLRDDTVVYSIERGEEDEGNSLLQHCPFQAGDRILSINNKRTQHMDSTEAARILREASGFVTIVCHNAGGDPCLIETMITKANKNQRSGMGLKSTGSRDLRVSSVNENGLFAQSLLNVGDRILTINEVDVTEVDARVACDIIKSSPDRVTVVARQSHTTAVVVAEVSTRGLRSSDNGQVLEVVQESGSSNDPNEIEAVDDTFQLTKNQREQLMIALCITLLLVGIMAGVFGRQSDDTNT